MSTASHQEIFIVCDRHERLRYVTKFRKTSGAVAGSWHEMLTSKNRKTGMGQPIVDDAPAAPGFALREMGEYRGRFVLECPSCKKRGGRHQAPVLLREETMNRLLDAAHEAGTTHLVLARIAAILN